MNEILFRGKTPDGEWKKGLVVGVVEGKPNFLREFGKDGFGYFDWYIISDTVGQDTGYSDKNFNLCNFKQSDIAVVGNIHDNPIISVEVV